MSINNPLVSVVVVTYNRLDYLKTTIDSILSQTYKNIEVFIIGDGHQQGVKGYIDSINDERIFYSYVEHCGYPAKGRNLGISMSTGEIIAFCDDDDLWLQNKLERQLDVFRDNDKLLLCCTDRKTIDSKGDIIDIRNLKYKPKRFNKNKLLLSNFVSYSSVMTRKSTLLNVDCFIDDIKFRAVEDYHLWLKIASKGNILFINEALTLYRVHNNNISKSLLEGTKKVIKVYDDIFKKYNYSALNKSVAYCVVYTKLIIYRIFK